MKNNPLYIGFAVHRSATFDRDILRGIARYAASKPNWVFSSVIPQRRLWRSRSTPRLAGLIASVSTKAIAHALSSFRRPLVNVTAVLPHLRYPTVRIDNTLVGELAATHFLERGLRHFAYIGPTIHLFSVERHAAFTRALAKQGFAAAAYFIRTNKPFDPFFQRWDLDHGVQQFLRAQPKPVGVFIPGDEWGVQLTEACRLAGLRVPEDVAVLSVDNDDLDCEMSRPRLSSIILPSERIGYEAAALLDRLLAGDKRPDSPVLLPPLGVATRRSTEVLAIDDLDVVKAVRFVREHAHRQLRVAEVAREIAVGRRTLERRCRQALGWSLGEEICRVHLERARHLLVQTDLPMTTIAKKAGFSGLHHMGQVFRRHLMMPPTAYRRQTRISH